MRLIPCLLAALLALAHSALGQTKEASPALRRQVRHALDRGLTALMEGPITDLATRGKGSRVGERTDGLCLYTALHAGASRYDKRLQRAAEALAQQRIRRTYQAACAIMALSRSDANSYRPSIERLVKFLVSSQTHGVWGYPGGADLSNTQYAALGLWAAHQNGVGVERKVWEELAAALPDFVSEGGFGYTRGGGGATVSMTAAGVACAHICQRMLSQGGAAEEPWTEEELHDLRLLEARGLAWLGYAFDAGKGVRAQPPLEISFYALYGIERAAELTGHQLIGAHDWYREGALYLVGTQSENGFWSAVRPGVVDASFALLFLARATREVRAPLSGHAASRVPSPILAMEAGLEADPTSEAFEKALEKLHMRDLGRNVLPLMEPQVLPGRGTAGHDISMLSDTRPQTYWEPMPQDHERGLKMAFKHPRSIDTILISRPPGAPGSRRMLVRVNGRTYPAILPKDERRKARLELAEPVLLKTLELTQVEGDGDAPQGLSPIAEIEAQLR